MMAPSFCQRLLTRAIAEELFAVGVDVISTGNHWADLRETIWSA